jgi:hypothetical protein
MLTKTGTLLVSAFIQENRFPVHVAWWLRMSNCIVPFDLLTATAFMLLAAIGGGFHPRESASCTRGHIRQLR